MEFPRILSTIGCDNGSLNGRLLWGTAMTTDAGRIQAIVKVLLEIPDAAARGDALDRECGNDLELRGKIETLLREMIPAGTAVSHISGAMTGGTNGHQPKPITVADSRIDNAATLPPRVAVTTPSGDGAAVNGNDAARGLLLAGRYRLGKEIARGGMGKVNWATDELFNREVAVKFLLASPLEAPDLVKRFRYEAQVTARLQHPGIPPVHDLGTDENSRPFLVMKLIQGHTLQKHLHDRKSPSDELPRWIQVFEQVAKTVGFAHGKNVIHRDLKPQNIMLGVFGEVQVMDWGLAKELGSDRPEPAHHLRAAAGADAVTRAGQILGTLQYMAPEQARGEVDQVDARADVFALGAILCEILTGAPPYQAETEVGLLCAAVEADLGKAHAALKQCGADEELIALAIRCLSPAKEDRPANGTEVADAVAAYRVGDETGLQDDGVSITDSGGHDVFAETAFNSDRSGEVIQLSMDPDETTLPPGVAPLPSAEFPFLAPPRQPNELGYLGPYRVLGVIGAGGMGAVFRAEDPTLRRQIALKVMLPEMARDRTAKARFLREARAQAAVEHDHIIAIYQVGEEGDVPFISMPLLKGETLADALKATPVLPVGEAVRIAREMASGLAAAHEQQLVHRDIKPANIWLEGRSRRVKILDFGLARTTTQDAEGGLTETGLVFGTPAYMSPEQTAGETLDGRTDLFSLGLVLHQMLTGRQTFTGRNATAILVAVNSHNPPRPSELNPLVPADLDALTMRLLAKDPAGRPASAEAVAEELSAIASRLGRLADLPGTATPVSGPPNQSGCTSAEVTEVAMASPTESIPSQTPSSPFVADADAPIRSRKPWYIAGGLFALLIIIGIVASIANGPTTKKTPDGQPLPPLPQPPQPPPNGVAELLASPDWVWGVPENLGPGVNTVGRELSPTLTSDELTIVFARNQNLWMSRRGSIKEQFGKAERLPNLINNTQIREECSISGDGLMLVFSSSRNGTTHGEIRISERKSLAEPFGDPVRVPDPVNRTGWSITPALSADGLSLLVTTTKPNTLGGGDIVMYTRNTRTEAFGNETIFPVPVNSPFHDIASWISDDRRVLIRTNMDTKLTRFHTRATADDPFGPPQLLYAPNPHRVWLSPDGMRMYFHSREVPGGEGDLDIWVVHRVRKK